MLYKITGLFIKNEERLVSFALKNTATQVEEGATTSPIDNYQVTVHVDQTALASGKGRSGLPIESVKRLCCDSDAVVIVENKNEEPLVLQTTGRNSRTRMRLFPNRLN